MGALHARTVARHEQTQLAWVHDHHPSRAEALAQLHGVRPEPGPCDLVIVATPATTHAAVLASFPTSWVLVEKPLAPTAAEARDMVREGVLVAHSERHAWRFPEARPTSARLVRRAPFRGRGADVDVFADLAIHDLDLLIWRAGEVQVEAAMKTGLVPHDDVELTVRWEGGRATIEARRSPGPSGCELRFDGQLLERPGGPDALSRQLTGAIQRMTGQTSSVPAAAEAHVALQHLEAARRLCSGFGSG